VGWLAELQYRYRLRESWQKSDNKWAMQLFQNIQAHRLVTSTGYRGRSNFIQGRRDYPEGYTYVESLTNYNAYSFSSLEQNKSIIDQQVKIIQQEKNISAEDAFDDWLFEPYEITEETLPENCVYAQVKLHATDEQIKADFADWLAHERAKRAQSLPKRNFNEVDFKGWCDSAVLPYLDLQFWAETEGVRIHQYIMAEAIFPEAYAVSAEVDPIGKLKTTKKKAVYLMRKDILEALGAIFI